MLLKYGGNVRKKLLLKYLVMMLPFLVGSIMYCFSIYNIVSSLLFFVGGYVFIKNVFDYRKVNKNINKEKEKVLNNCNRVYRDYDSIPMLKRTRIHRKVRKKIKNIDF